MLTLATATLNRYDLLVQMLDSAESGSRPPDRYFIVDNGRKLEYSQIPRVAQKTTIHRVEANLGVAASVNLIYRENDDLTVWTNDDVRFNTDTLAEVERVALEDPSRLFVVPLQNPTGIFTVFCARRSLFEKIGWFDERFFPAYFEDNDFGYRMKLAGIPYHYAQVGYAHHGSATIAAYTAAERSAHDDRFRALATFYKAKWGGPPGHETFTEPQA
jgi:GT2 family glycosyltransferase